jgi:hypothetical protein
MLSKSADARAWDKQKSTGSFKTISSQILIHLIVVQGWSWLVTKRRTSLYVAWTSRKGNHDVAQKPLWANTWFKQVMPTGSPEPNLEHKNALKPLLCKLT